MPVLLLRICVHAGNGDNIDTSGRSGSTQCINTWSTAAVKGCATSAQYRFNLMKYGPCRSWNGCYTRPTQQHDQSRTRSGRYLL